MLEIIREITLDVSEENRFTAITAKQYDSRSRYLLVRLTDRGEALTLPDTASVLISATRPDGLSDGFEGRARDGAALVPLDYWMLMLDGTVTCELVVTGEDGYRLTTMSFALDVRHSCFGDGPTPGGNHGVYVRLLEEIEELKKKIGEGLGGNGTVTDEQISAAVEKYLTEHPIESPEVEKAAESARKSAEEAEASVGEAQTAATNAGKSATAASESAANAEASEEAAATSESNAAKSATAATGSATTASNAATAAQTAQGKAETAQAAAESAKSTASQKATEAANAAQTATSKATAASKSATAAGTAKTAAEAAAARAEEAANRLLGVAVVGVIETVNGAPSLVLTGVQEVADYTAYYKVVDEEGNETLVEIGQLVPKDETEPDPVTYTIKWTNYGGEVLKTVTVAEGDSEPEYDGPTPTRAEDGQYTYTFKGWDKTVDDATGDVTYTATYTQTAIEVEPAEPTNFFKATPTVSSKSQGSQDAVLLGGRLGSDKTYRDDGGPDCLLTNYIRVQSGDVVEMTNLAFNSLNSAMYKSDKTMIGAFQSTDTAYVTSVSTSGKTQTFTVANANAGYVRVSGQPNSGIKVSTSGSSVDVRYDLSQIIVKVKRNGVYQ